MSRRPPEKLLGLSIRGYAKFTAGFTAVTSMILGLGTMQLKWLPWAPVWGSFYLLSAACCTVLFWKFPNARATAFAGASTIVAHTMRGLVLFLGKAFDLDGVGNFPWWQIVVGCTIFWVAAFAATMLFFTRVAVLDSAERHRTT